jgi:hypothetical protein
MEGLEHDLDKALNMKLVLCPFEQLSGMKINFYKRKIFYFEKVKEEEKTRGDDGGGNRSTGACSDCRGGKCHQGHRRWPPYSHTKGNRRLVSVNISSP